MEPFKVMARVLYKIRQRVRKDSREKSILGSHSWARVSCVSTVSFSWFHGVYIVYPLTTAS